jgi:phosphoglycerate dehydrogenase-like enzyme
VTIKYCVGPTDAPAWLRNAVLDGGGELTDISVAEALIWPHSPGLESFLAAASPRLRWVSLPTAGIERWESVVDDRRMWTAAKGVYAEPVAEMAVALALSGLRQVGHYARIRKWSPPLGVNLQEGRVVILGGGGIAEAVVRLLHGFGTSTTVVRRRPTRMDLVDDVVAPDQLCESVVGATVLIVAAALTAETRQMVDQTVFSSMAPHAWLVNVARGPIVDTEALVAALVTRSIGGAALDVTDPEPLPDGHPLWDLDNCIITPHVGNTPEMHQPLLEAYVRENISRFTAGEPLIGVVDPSLGY